MNLYLLYLISIFVLIGCTLEDYSLKEIEKNENKKSDNKLYLNQQIAKRDSLFVLETVHQYIDSNIAFYEVFRDTNKFNINDISIVSFNYSPDSLKFVALFTINYTAMKDDLYSGFYKKDESYHHAMALIGYRNLRNEIWFRTYPLNNIIIGLYPEKENAISDLIEYYYKKIRTDVMKITVFNSDNEIDSKTISYRFGIGDSLFWTNSPLWKKGLQIEGFFPFELHRNAGEVYPNRIKEHVFCIYSDSLKEMYE